MNRFHQKTIVGCSVIRRRRGAALLICMLAAAAVSLSAMAILRSLHRSSLRTQSIESIAADRQVAMGIANAAVSQLKANPTLSGDLYYPSLSEDARVAVTRVSSKETLLTVWLFPAATQPAYIRTVDPSKL
ncbi:hypothetical protein FF011L_00380 [Roseimaritima multifibrata]|uniref:Uncharacterized protein n=1 Tax=Roseimaritima multifibrata TaxID=1930274 RepID=A0A517M8V7_9BACT|nr:hypothetical protein [Roseimaritima multifibrata]QDS91309.1 hypothetical protein FF011L_00380 [Roseimaritima multifibrata]